jgi:hypothetical protein
MEGRFHFGVNADMGNKDLRADMACRQQQQQQQQQQQEWSSDRSHAPCHQISIGGHPMEGRLHSTGQTPRRVTNTFMLGWPAGGGGITSMITCSTHCANPLERAVSSAQSAKVAHYTLVELIGSGVLAALVSLQKQQASRHLGRAAAPTAAAHQRAWCCPFLPFRPAARWHSSLTHTLVSGS